MRVRLQSAVWGLGFGVPRFRHPSVVNGHMSCKSMYAVRGVLRDVRSVMCGVLVCWCIMCDVVM